MRCEPQLCEYGPTLGGCIAVGGFGDYGICITAEMESTECEPYSTGCETEYGVVGATVCLPNPDGGTVCVEMCEVPEEDCELSSGCIPLGSSEHEGVCVPLAD